MARLIAPFMQFFDKNGKVLSFGEIEFFESGSSTVKKTVFGDISETTPLLNPVILDADGRIRDVFGTGTYRAILSTTSSGPEPQEQIQVIDPLGGQAGAVYGSAWSASNIYGVSDVVLDADLYWISLIAGNQGNRPSTDTGVNWTQYPSTAQLPDDVMTTPKILDKNVTTAKIAEPLAHFYTNTGPSDAYVFTAAGNTPTAQTYTIGMILEAFIAPADENTGASTVIVDGVSPAQNIKLESGADPAVGDIAGNVRMRYDGTNFVLEQILPQGAVPVGGTLFWDAPVAPAGRWLLKDGAAVSRTTFAALFAVYGTYYGIGDGVNTFNLPDDRGLFPRVRDNGAAVDPDAGTRTVPAGGTGAAGDFNGTEQAGQNEGHVHAQSGQIVLTNIAAGPTAIELIGAVPSTFNTQLQGGAETRPINKYYEAWVRY